MARAYPGYVYQPYPKMISDITQPTGYRIVKTEEEHQEYLKSVTPLSAPEKKTKKLKFDLE